MSEYLIWSHERGAWWKPARRGYTSDVAEAGHYPEETATRIVADSACGWRHGQLPPEVMVPAPPDGLRALALILDMAVANETERMVAARELRSQPAGGAR